MLCLERKVNRLKLSKHFNSSEFACKCGCGFDSISRDLVEVLEDLRETYGFPVMINSGCRCLKHNKTVGGEPNSKHMEGIAADIVVKGLSPAKVYQYLDSKYKDTFGIGLYKTWVHIDTRTRKTRWEK